MLLPFRTVLPLFSLTGSLVLLFAAACQKEHPQPAEQIRAIKTFTVSERAPGTPRKFPGVVEAVDTSALSFEVSGNVQEVRVDVGHMVKKGQVLAVLDKRDFLLNVESAKADRAREQAQQTQRRKDFERVQNIFREDSGATSQAALDEAEAAYESAKSNVSYAAAKLDLARRDLEKTVLVAPFDGVIAERHIDPFQQVSPGQKIFDLFAQGAMEVSISIPETVIDKVTVGLPAEIRFPTEPGPIYKGKISKLGSAAGAANAFPSQVMILDSSQRILPGMTAEVTLLLPLGIEGNAFLIPVQAIAVEDDTIGYVFIFDSTTSTVKKKAVTVTGFRGNNVIVASGVNTGDVIASAGVTFLEDGQQVKLLTS